MAAEYKQKMKEELEFVLQEREKVLKKAGKKA